MKRYGSVIGVKPEAIAEYKRLHADVWPEVLKQIKNSNIRNYSIYLKEPENIMFSYLEYVGTDFEADMKAMAADPKTQEWWAVCGPLQAPLESRKPGEWWASMEEVFHID
jgi:L-rhamnose mutarotase